MIGRFKNWKTTTLGFATAFFGFVAFKPQYFPHWLGDVAAYVTAGGLAAAFAVAKDKNVTGGTIQQ